jgi:hypothetical protein
MQIMKNQPPSNPQARVNGKGEGEEDGEKHVDGEVGAITIHAGLNGTDFQGAVGLGTKVDDVGGHLMSHGAR